MDNLREIYDRIKLLRANGVKMKDIAAQAGYTPSVMSALFMTVMPAYFKNLDAGMLPDEAIGDALAWVNNVSKRKLLGSLAEVRSALFAMDAVPAPSAETAGTDAPCPLVGELLQGMQAAMRLSPALFGTYMSYSASLGSTAMKA